MTAKEVFDKIQEEINSIPRTPEQEAWIDEGVRAFQERYIREYFENKIASPE